MPTPEQFISSGGYLVMQNPALPPIDGGVVLQAVPDLQDHCLFRTSGTEGDPKLVALSRDALLASAKSVNVRFGVKAEDRWLSPLPEFHVGGFGVLARSYAAGCTVQKLEAWNPAEFGRLAADFGATMTSLVPTQVFDLVIAQQRAPESLRCAIVGGGALDHEIAERAWALGWRLVASYGMTEAGSMVAAESSDDLGGDKPLQLLENWEARNDETSGALEIRGSSLLTGYVRLIDGIPQFEDPKDDDGWFRTSDRVEVEGEELRFVSRLGDQVKVLGEFVDLDEMQRRVVVHAESMGVDPNSLVVVALKDRRAGQEVALAYVGSGELKKAMRRLLKRVNEGMAGYERIRRAIPVEDIPRGALGKPLRKKLQLLLTGR